MTAPPRASEGASDLFLDDLAVLVRGEVVLAGQDLGFGRTATSETEAPIMLANLV